MCDAAKTELLKYGRPYPGITISRHLATQTRGWGAKEFRQKYTAFAPATYD